ncbi:hypothetical protein KQX54_011813 [Cotesia glomerata]|uniref:Uncharacterized protein n=1 Tax=Cotesia glomerata TaxID=32391 RepID=A0AAV7J6P8_COTGL|nr:hypothetical protein KQX54_011813 [Cotesia glomerata]
MIHGTLVEQKGCLKKYTKDRPKTVKESELEGYCIMSSHELVINSPKTYCLCTFGGENLLWSTRRKRKGEEMMERKEKREIVELHVDLTLPRRSGQDLLPVDDLVINAIDHFGISNVLLFNSPNTARNIE